MTDSVASDLPPEICELSHKLNLKNVPEDFVQNYLKKNVPKLLASRTDISTYILKLESDFRKRTKPHHRQSLIKAKLKRQLKLYDVKKEGFKFEQFVKVHVLWKEYMEGILGNFRDKNLVYQKLLRADYHGCYLVVAHACCQTQIGLAGLVVQETRNTFRLLTPKDKVVTIPKDKTIFALEFKGKLIKLYGTNFCFRPEERSRTKIKAKRLDRF